jgi:hypothetical protein
MTINWLPTLQQHCAVQGPRCSDLVPTKRRQGVFCKRRRRLRRWNPAPDKFVREAKYHFAAKINVEDCAFDCFETQKRHACVNGRRRAHHDCPELPKLIFKLDGK